MALVRTSTNTGGSAGPLSAFGNNRLKLDVGTVAFDSSYPTGGETISFGQKFKKVLSVIFESQGGWMFEYVPATSKVFARVISSGAEVSSTYDLSALTAVSYIAVGY